MLPQVEDVYMNVWRWHDVNQPSPSQTALLMCRAPAGLHDRKDIVSNLHAWDTTFTKHMEALLPWAPHLALMDLYSVYTNGLREIHSACWKDARSQADLVRHSAAPLRFRIEQARSAMYAVAMELQQERQQQAHINHLRLVERPSAAAIKSAAAPASRTDQPLKPPSTLLKSALVDKPSSSTRRRTSLRFSDEPRAYHTSGQSHLGPSAPAPASQPDPFQSGGGWQPATWQWTGSGVPQEPPPLPPQPAAAPSVYATSATPRPASFPALPAPPPADTRNPFAPPTNYSSPQGTAPACSICTHRHSGVCFVDRPDLQEDWWWGPPKGKLAVLRAQAEALGMTAEGYARQLIEDGMALERKARTTAFDELFAPVQERFRKSGMSEEELDALVDAARSRHQRRATRKTA